MNEAPPSPPAETGENGGEPTEPSEVTDRLRRLAGSVAADRPIALVGLMGAGKTTVGRRLATVLGLAFVDADAEIEKAAGMRVTEIFERLGEPEFRRGERRVIERLLDGPPLVLATGGGAFVQTATRELLQAKALTVWLRADLDVLMRRVLRRDTRPLLRGPDPRAVMSNLMAARYPLYADADITVDSDAGPQIATVEAVLRALSARRGDQRP
jgi:shikimate kinase